MKKLYLKAIVFGFCLCVFSKAQAEVPSAPAKVYVEGSQLFVAKRNTDGSLDEAKPYIIKGVTWSAATAASDYGPNPSNPKEEVEYGFFFDWPGRYPVGSEILSYWMKTQFVKHYACDLALMKEMNVNTIRVYHPFGDDPADYKKILDECYRQGIMVIMTPAISKRDIDSGDYLKAIKMCKDHPAILMWSLGNEWNFEYNKYWGYKTVAEAAQATERIAAQIKKIDPNHPVSSCLGDRFDDPEPPNTISSIINTCNNIDLWGLNVYRGESFGDIFLRWKKITTKPFYFSEFGTDSFSTKDFKIVNGFQTDDCRGREDQDRQAEFVLNLWNQIEKHLSADNPNQQCLGGLVHEFNDSLWKVGSYHVSLGGLVDYYSDEKFSYSQYNCEGFYLPGSHPDNVANEEYFGVVDAQRNPKKVFFALKEAYSK